MHKLFPKAVPLKKLLGPSFIILALGLGSGEVILWPYLVSNHGLGILWAAILGISCQYFINMEIARYALVKGESVFVGLNKVFSWSPYWFIASTFLAFGLPGIIAASAEVMAAAFGFDGFKWVAIALLLVIGMVLSLSKTVYGMMETVTKIIIVAGVSFIFILAVFLAWQADWGAVAAHGNAFALFPEGISLAVFLAAFAYSGAGGNLNLTQSIYIKEKGYGMGAYAQKIGGLFNAKGKSQEVKLTDETFELTQENVGRFHAWWRNISLEHFLVFWLMGSFAMGLLMLLSFVTVFNMEGNIQGIHFVINEGSAISRVIFPWAGRIFLLVIGVMLFQTQLGILDSTSRIMAENVAVKKLGRDEKGKINLSRIYFIFLWLQIAFGVVLFLADIYEPKMLIVVGAVINAVSMTIHIALVQITNHKLLAKELRPRLWRKMVLFVIFIIFAGFSSFAIFNTFF